MTIKEVFEILNIKLPKKLISRQNEVAEVVSGFLPHVISRTGIFFDINPEPVNIASIKRALEKNSIIITNKTYLDDDGQELAVIKINNPKEKYYEFGKYLKKIRKVPTIGITGSIGKSTTTRMAVFVFSEKYKVFSSTSTSNIPEYYIKELYQHLFDDYNFHIQETGGARPDLVKESVEILDVDAFCLTNINKFHHLDKYLTSENLIKDKTSYDRYSKKEAIGVVNADDEILSNYKYNRKVITFGIKNNKATYVARNIEQQDDWLVLDIFHNGKKEITIKVNIIGKHNAYNVLAVYALAKIFKLSKEEIIEGFLKYRSAGIRQNLNIVCGRYLYIDCFNVCSDSIKSCLDSLEDIKVKTNSKKIAILGGENALGDKTYEVNYNTGISLKKYKTIDQFIFVGSKDLDTDKINLLGDGKALYDGAKTVLDSDKIVFYDDIIELSCYLEKNTRPGDIILLKGIFRLGLVGAIDMAFGTSFIYDIFYFYNNSKIVSDDFFTGRVIKTIEKIDSTKCINMTAEQLIIPDSIDGYDVVHLKKGLCKGAKSKNIKLGKKLKNISSLAFSNCSNLLKIKIPGNIRLIDDKAFYNCSSLEVVKIKNGVLQINSKAFSKCSNLKKVYLPKSVIEIADDAFPHRKSIKFVTFRGSYARNYINDRYNRKGVISRIIRKIKRIIKSKV